MLRTRLFLNLVPFVIILLSIGVYAMVLFSQLARTMDVTVTLNYRSVTSAEAMRLALDRMQRGVLLVFEDGGNLGRALFDESQAVFQSNLDLQIQSATLPNEAELTRQLKTNYLAFQQAGRAILSGTETERQRNIYETEFYPGLAAINRQLEQIRALNHQAILATSQKLQGLAREAARLMALGMVAALGLALYASVRLSRSILGPIQSLTKATRELGEGRLGHSVPVVSRDELGELAIAFNKMSAQLEAYRQSTSEEILRLHRTMETTLASFPDPIFVLDRDGRIELRNPAAHELAASLHLDGALPGRLQDLSRQILESGQSFLPDNFKEVICFRLEGQERFFLPRIVAMRNKGDALFGVAVVLYDVTRFRLLDDAKTNLVATVSHELKSPLTSVRMVLHLLLEKTVGTLTPKQSELLVTARDDAERLLSILNDLLDLARLEEGHSELHKETVPAAELVRGVAEEMREAAAAQRLKIHVEIEPSVPPAYVDPQRIRHVFTNLISNAIKHSPPGGEIRLRAAQTESGEIQFSVLDEGPGVPDEYKGRIFDRFFRVPGQKKTGAGLGLSIAREIVVAHGGRIGMRARSGPGSEFYFVLNPAPALAE